MTPDLPESGVCFSNGRCWQAAGLGDWVIVDGLVYENFHEREFDLDEIGDAKTICGLDFGFTNDPTAFSLDSWIRRTESCGYGMSSTAKE